MQLNDTPPLDGTPGPGQTPPTQTESLDPDGRPPDGTPGQQAGGTHPTGMLSCFIQNFNLSIWTSKLKISVSGNSFHSLWTSAKI